MSSISFKIQAFFVPQLQQPSFLSDAGSWLESCSSVTLSIYWLITSSRPVQKGRVKHCSHMGHSLVSLPRQGMGATLPSMARRISPAV